MVERRIESNEPQRTLFEPLEKLPSNELINGLKAEFSKVITEYLIARKRENSLFGIRLGRLYGQILEQYANAIPPYENDLERAERYLLENYKRYLDDRNYLREHIVDYYYDDVKYSLEDAKFKADRMLQGFLAEHITRLLLFAATGEKSKIYYPSLRDEDNGIDAIADYRKNPNVPEEFRMVLYTQVKSVDLTESGQRANKVIYHVSPYLRIDEQLKEIKQKMDDLLMPDYLGNEDNYGFYKAKIIESMEKNLRYVEKVNVRYSSSGKPVATSVLVVIPRDPEFGFTIPTSQKAIDLFRNKFTDDKTIK